MSNTGRERLLFEVVTAAGRAVDLEVRVHPLTVEIWRGTRQGVFNRAELRTWLSDPQSPIRANIVTFSLDRGGTGRYTISLPDIPAWVLSPREADAFDARV